MYFDGKQYPFVQLKELSSQLPQVSQRYRQFNDYKYEETETLFPEETQKQGFVLKTYNLASGVFFNQGNQLEFQKLPMRAQLSPVYAIETGDFNRDGYTDILVGGNFAQAKPEVGTYKASFGSLFQGTGDGTLNFIPNKDAGFSIDGSIRSIEKVSIGERNVLIIARNNQQIYTIEYAKPK